MYSKFFEHSQINMLEQQIDIFLKELDEVTGNIIETKMLKHDENILVLIIYNCWKKL